MNIAQRLDLAGFIPARLGRTGSRLLLAIHIHSATWFEATATPLCLKVLLQSGVGYPGYFGCPGYPGERLSSLQLLSSVCFDLKRLQPLPSLHTDGRSPERSGAPQSVYVYVHLEHMGGPLPPHPLLALNLCSRPGRRSRQHSFKQGQKQQERNTAAVH